MHKPSPAVGYGSLRQYLLSSDRFCHNLRKLWLKPWFVEEDKPVQTKYLSRVFWYDILQSAKCMYFFVPSDLRAFLCHQTCWGSAPNVWGVESTRPFLSLPWSTCTLWRQVLAVWRRQIVLHWLFFCVGVTMNKRITTYIYSYHPKQSWNNRLTIGS